MVITRLDALHPAGDGCFCQFFAGKTDRPRLAADCLRVCGWEVDVYEEELGPMGREHVAFLTQGLWPQLPTTAILEWFPLYLPEEVNPDQAVEMRRGA